MVVKAPDLGDADELRAQVPRGTLHRIIQAAGQSGRIAPDDAVERAGRQLGHQEPRRIDRARHGDLALRRRP